MEEKGVESVFVYFLKLRMLSYLLQKLQELKTLMRKSTKQLRKMTSQGDWRRQSANYCPDPSDSRQEPKQMWCVLRKHNPSTR
jgi:hypothetical protein